MNAGLSSEEAQKRLKTYGYNELPRKRSSGIIRVILEVFKEPMFILLIACGVLYLMIGDQREGTILLCAISVIIVITLYQYQKTEKALEALRKLSSPRVLVIRDGEEIRIPGREVVPGDLMVLNEGDRITADAKIIESINLSVDESLLTGESMPVNKEAEGTSDHILSGTLVVRGKGIAEVTSTGVNARLGKLAETLREPAENVTRMQKEMKVLVRRLAFIGIFISIAVVVLYYFTKGSFIHALLTGLSASMSILPEEFPVVLTVFLALGAWRLSRRKVLTRKPSAIEALGSATVLCTDKTGTITQNKMEVAAVYNGDDIIFKKDYLTQGNAISELVTAVHRATQSNPVDPMEKAIGKLYTHVFEETQKEHALLREYPLSKELLAMTRVLEDPEDNSISVSAKGAPEAIFKLCGIDGEEKERHMKVVNTLAEKGYRMLGVATSDDAARDLPDKQSGFRFRFVGLIALEDPIRPEVPEAIRECHTAGVRVIMITGDFPATAKSIAEQAGLDPGGMIRGDELQEMSDDELKKRIGSVNIFSRVVPEQKLRIVKALKSNAEIVAMTGDGVNDAPALHSADIGIAMGNKGTDVAREASSLVLLDDNFASIVSAIRLGRRIFDNLQKAMSYIIAVHIPIIGLTLLPALIRSFPPLLLPLHIVFMELIIDPICSIAFESEQEERMIMSRPPRSTEEKFFGGRSIFLSVLRGVLLLAMVLTVHFLSYREGHTEGEVRAIAFCSLIIGNVFLILTQLSKTRSAFSLSGKRNWPAVIILVSAFIMLILAISVPALSTLFSFEFPGYGHFIPALTGAFIVLSVLEFFKFARNRKEKRSLKSITG